VKCQSETATWLVFFLLPDWIAAHPVDEVVQATYLTLAPGAVRLELDLTPGALVSQAILQALDTNADQHITDAEAKAYAERVLKQSTFTLDGMATAWRLEKVNVPLYQSLKLEGNMLKIYAVAARTDKAGTHTLSYDNRYQPAQSQCIANVFLQSGAGWHYQVISQKHSDDGRRLTVNYIDTQP
jgi:hypothetical protein